MRGCPTLDGTCFIPEINNVTTSEKIEATSDAGSDTLSGVGGFGGKDEHLKMQKHPMEDMVFSFPGLSVGATVLFGRFIACLDDLAKKVVKRGSDSGRELVGEGGAVVGRVRGDVEVDGFEGVVPIRRVIWGSGAL